jgi:hypothetical protein
MAGISVKITPEIMNGDIHEPGSCFQGSPCHVRGDETIPGCQKGISGLRGFYG